MMISRIVLVETMRAWALGPTDSTRTAIWIGWCLPTRSPA